MLTSSIKEWQTAPSAATRALLLPVASLVPINALVRASVALFGIPSSPGPRHKHLHGEQYPSRPSRPARRTVRTSPKSTFTKDGRMMRSAIVRTLSCCSSGRPHLLYTTLTYPRRRTSSACRKASSNVRRRDCACQAQQKALRPGACIELPLLPRPVASGSVLRSSCRLLPPVPSAQPLLLLTVAVAHVKLKLSHLADTRYVLLSPQSQRASLSHPLSAPLSPSAPEQALAPPLVLTQIMILERDHSNYRSLCHLPCQPR